MEQRIVPGAVVDHAGGCWQVERPLGADAVLLRNKAGEVVCASPATISVSSSSLSTVAVRPLDERLFSEADWSMAARRRDLLTALLRLPRRGRADIDKVAGELGLGRRRVFALMRQVQAGCGVEDLLPVKGGRRTKRLGTKVEAIIGLAVDQHYAKPNRPSILGLWRNAAERCRAAGLPAPSYRAVQARVRAADQAWLTRRRHGPAAARSMRLLTGAHPGAAAPWERVQIDSTPCDIRLVREDDRTVIGRPTVTFAVDLYSRVVLGFSVSLEAASTVTVATCLAHACLPKDDWLARRDLTEVHWPVWGRPGTLEYDQGPENEARGIQRGLRLHGIAAKVRARGHPEQHGAIERLIGTMMRKVHGLRGTTWSGIEERGESRPDQQACLSLPELERILALTIDSYNHAVHEGIAERPLDRYLAYYRQPGLPDAERVPPRLPANRLLLDFLPWERRALTRCGIRLFRVDYSSTDLLPLWRRDNQQRVERLVVYDPRSLAQVWVIDEATGSPIPVPYRVPHPDMTLAQSGEARRGLQSLKVQDRTERRLFDNLEKVRAIEDTARLATVRRRAERTVQAAKACGRRASCPPPALGSQILLAWQPSRRLEGREGGPPPLLRHPGPARSSSHSLTSSCCRVDSPVVSHLDDAARRALEFDDARRLALIDRDLWIGYGRARDAHARLGRILHSERRMRPDNLLVVGASNNGKTAIARRFLARNAVPEDMAAERGRIPVALIQTPNGPRIAPLLTAILEALGRGRVRRTATAQLRVEVYQAMQDVGLRLLLIDDLHNIRGAGVGSMLVELRQVGSVTGVSLGAFATREIAYALRQDEQMANRFELVTLPRWRYGDVEYAQLLATFERQLPLRRASNLTDPALAEQILLAAGGLIGGVARLLRHAAAEAVTSGHERIDQAMLDRVGTNTPERIEAVALAADL